MTEQEIQALCTLCGCTAARQRYAMIYTEPTYVVVTHDGLYVCEWTFSAATPEWYMRSLGEAIRRAREDQS